MTAIATKLWKTNPQFTAPQVIQTLTSITKDLNTPGWDAETEFGLVNQAAAIQQAKQTPPQFTEMSHRDRIDMTWQSVDGAIATERPNRLLEGMGTETVVTQGRPAPAPSPYQGMSADAAEHWIEADRNEEIHKPEPLPYQGMSADAAERWIEAEQNQEQNHRTYTIQPGDTLSAIAQRQLGDSSRWTEITDENGNPFTAAEASRLQIGQAISLPGTDQSSASQNHPSENAINPEQKTYTIRSGDTLSAIAQRKLGDSSRWTKLQKADGSSFTEAEASRLQVGQQIVLPDNPISPPEPPEIPPQILRAEGLPPSDLTSGNGSPRYEPHDVPHPPDAAEIWLANPDQKRELLNLRANGFPAAEQPPSLTQAIVEMSHFDKIGEAFQRSLPLLGEEVLDSFSQFTELENLLQTAAETVINNFTPWSLIRKTLHLIGSVSDAYDVGMNLWDFYTGTRDAKTEEDLNQTAQHLATAISTVGVDIVLGMFISGIGNKTEAADSTNHSSEPQPSSSDSDSDNRSTNPQPNNLIFTGGAWRTSDGRFASDPNAPSSDQRQRNQSAQNKFMREQLNTILGSIEQQGSHPFEFLVDPQTRNWRSRSAENTEHATEPGVQAGHLTSFHGLSEDESEQLAVEDAWTNWWSSLSERLGDIHTQKAIEIDGVIVERMTAQYWEDIGKLPKGTVSNTREVDGWIVPPPQQP